MDVLELNDGPGGITKKEAKATFNTEVEKASDSSEKELVNLFLPQLPPGNIIPDWKKTKVYDEGSCTKMEIATELAFRYRAYQIDSADNDTSIIRMNTKLVIVKERETGNKTCYLEYDIRANGTGKNEYNSPSYSGLKIFTDMNGSIVKISRYVNGQRTVSSNIRKAADKKDFLSRIFLAQSLLANVDIQKGIRATKADYNSGAESEGDYIYLKIGNRLLRISREIYDKLMSGELTGYTDPETGIYYGGELEAAEIVASQDPDPEGENGNTNATNPYIPGEGSGGGVGGNSGSGSNGNPKNEQNERGSAKVPFPDTFRYKGYGVDGLDCFGVCSNVLEQLGYKICSKTEAIYLKKEFIDANKKHKLRDISDNDRSNTIRNIGTSEECVQYLKNAINQGIPVVVGVDYRTTLISNRTGEPINEGTTDHFIVIYEYSHDIDGLFFRYIESGRKLWANAKWQNYILRYSDGSLSGIKYKGEILDKENPTYTVTQYRTTIHNK